ncbi:MAG: SRPBCC domain-containing protein [Luteimonas sp.]|nr:SRPBCC domain-containing protein [Luteimonas sp.]
MSANNRLVSRIVIAGSQEAIWRELTKQGEPQAAVFNAWLHAQSLAPGKTVQMRTASGGKVIVVGEVLEFDPPHRFAHTFRFTQYDDPPCTVIYELKPVDGGVEVSLIVENLPVGTKTGKSMESGSRSILDTLKAVVEQGRPKLGTRLMYAIFDRLEFALPKRCDAKFWPL